MTDHKKEKLNPWHIETEFGGRDSVYIRIIDETSGEIRLLHLTVDEINDIIKQKERKG